MNLKLSAGQVPNKYAPSHMYTEGEIQGCSQVMKVGSLRQCRCTEVRVCINKKQTLPSYNNTHASSRSHDLEVCRATLIKHTAELEKFKKKMIRPAGQYHLGKFKTHTTRQTKTHTYARN